MDYKALPKIDLHCHLDGSVRIDTIRDLAKVQGIEIPENLKGELIAPETCQSLDEYLLRFDLPVRLMQTQENLERIAFELYEDAALENVKYLEVRFGPLLHVLEGLSIQEVLESVLKGMNRAISQYDIQGGIIISVLRTMQKSRIYELIDVASEYLDQGIVAIDLAASEVAGFCHEFVDHIAYARDKGFRVTIHAGETGIGQNVTDAIELLKAERIGHGIHIKNDEKATNLVKDKAVVLEVCPTSNVQTKAVESLESHPVKDFYDQDLYVSINTDNRTVSDTTMTLEVQKVMETFNFTLEDYKKIYRNSVFKAFTSDEVKGQLITHIEGI